MDEDWKKKIDNREERQRIKAERRRQEVEANQLAAIKAQKEARLQHLSKFKCHVCGTSACIPDQRLTGRTHDVPHDRGSGSDSVPERVDDWSQPGDLRRCKNCHKWTCNQHLYKETCQKCAETL